MLQLHLQSLKLHLSNVQKEMQLQENTIFDLGVKVTQKVAYFPTKFEVATFNCLKGDSFARNVTDGPTDRRIEIIYYLFLW